MTSDQLTGKYARLRRELAAAHAEPATSAGRSGRIDRIASELAVLEHSLAVQRLGARLVTLGEVPAEPPQNDAMSLAA